MILGGGFGGLAAARALDVPGGAHHAGRSQQPPPVPAPAVPGRHGGARRARRIGADPQLPVAAGQRHGAAWPGVQRSTSRRSACCSTARHLDYDYLILATGDDPCLLRPRPLGRARARAQDDRRRARHPAPDPARLRGRRARDRTEARRAWTTFVVIGGGPTGVELAGALAEIAGRTLARDFRHFDPRTTRVVLIEAGPAPAADVSRGASARRRARQLESLASRCAPARGHGYRRRLRRARRRDHRHAHRALGRGRAGEPAHGAPRRAARSRRARLGRGGSLGARPPRGLRHRRSHRQDPGRQAAAGRRAARRAERTLRRQANHAAACSGQPRAPSATSTRARWRPSGATRRSRRSGASASRASSRGGSGSWCTSSAWWAFAAAFGDHRVGLRLPDLAAASRVILEVPREAAYAGATVSQSAAG